MTTKALLRAEARARLRELDGAWRASASEAIAERVWSLPQLDAARTLLVYASLPTEVDTDPIAQEAARRGITLVYPRCLPASREMDLHHVRHPEDLRSAGSYGIREPDSECPRVTVEQIDAALVPGLAWDRSGTRMGRGAGYYDRLFQQPGWRGFRCGIFFSVQEFAVLPRDPWDAPLHAVATERESVVVGEREPAE